MPTSDAEKETSLEFNFSPISDEAPPDAWIRYIEHALATKDSDGIAIGWRVRGRAPGYRMLPGFCRWEIFNYISGVPELAFAVARRVWNVAHEYRMTELGRQYTRNVGVDFALVAVKADEANGYHALGEPCGEGGRINLGPDLATPVAVEASREAQYNEMVLQLVKDTRAHNMQLYGVIEKVLGAAGDVVGEGLIAARACVNSITDNNNASVELARLELEKVRIQVDAMGKNERFSAALSAMSSLLSGPGVAAMAAQLLHRFGFTGEGDSDGPPSSSGAATLLLGRLTWADISRLYVHVPLSDAIQELRDNSFEPEALATFRTRWETMRGDVVRLEPAPSEYAINILDSLSALE